MNSMLFSCEGMRHGKHHLFDGVENEQTIAAQSTFKHSKHTRIEASFGGTLSKKEEVLPTDFDEDIRDEDFDTE